MERNGVMAVRPMSDVDLLVHDQDLLAIDRILTGAGYRPQIDGNPAYQDPGGGLLLWGHALVAMRRARTAPRVGGG